MAGSESRLAALGRIGFIGAGAVGSALARALAGRGALVAAVTARTPAHATALARVLPNATAMAEPAEVAAACELIILAVPDDAISALATSVPWPAGKSVVHLSGAQGAEALAAAAERGMRVGALHPLMTFPRDTLGTPVEQILARLAGCTWALEAADARLAAVLARLVAALDGRVVRLAPADRVPYHIAGVLASNYVAALLGTAVHLWQPFEPDAQAALRALLPLLKATVANLEAVGLPDALTGPLARGDSGTVAAHLAWLDTHAGTSPDAALRDAYVALARLALPLAETKGTLTPEAAAELRRLLEGAVDGGTGTNSAG
jgi:predicted short-subunit dehydrogenase-like oxidoreductase (DUF2520 family)